MDNYNVPAGQSVKAYSYAGHVAVVVVTVWQYTVAYLWVYHCRHAWTRRYQLYRRNCRQCWHRTCVLHRHPPRYTRQYLHSKLSPLQHQPHFITPTWGKFGSVRRSRTRATTDYTGWHKSAHSFDLYDVWLTTGAFCFEYILSTIPLQSHHVYIVLNTIPLQSHQLHNTK